MGMIKKAASIFLFWLLSGCGPTDNQPSPEDYWGLWLITRADEGHKMQVGDVLKISKDTVVHYHMDSTGTPDILQKYGNPYLVETTMEVEWKSHGYKTKDAIDYYDFTIEDGRLMLWQPFQTIGSCARYKGPFPKPEWPWPATWVID